MSHLRLPILLVVGPVLVVARTGRPSSMTTPTAVTNGVVVESQHVASALGGCVVRGTVRNDDDTTVTARLRWSGKAQDGTKISAAADRVLPAHDVQPYESGPFTVTEGDARGKRVDCDEIDHFSLDRY